VQSSLRIINPIETQRLFLRELRVDDAESFYNLNLDPEVIKYTGDAAFGNIESARTFLVGYDQYKKYGFGRWAVIHKTSGEFLGWCGLKHSADLEETDLGFRFFKNYWNQGYATEAAIACVDIGFKHFGLNTIVGRARIENEASVRTLQKCGMSFERYFDFGGEKGVIYKIEKK
jgi:RimJ/RimL family protein N-acetyltransferase